MCEHSLWVIPIIVCLCTNFHMIILLFCLSVLIRCLLLIKVLLELSDCSRSWEVLMCYRRFETNQTNFLCNNFTESNNKETLAAAGEAHPKVLKKFSWRKLEVLALLLTTSWSWESRKVHILNKTNNTWEGSFFI